MDTKTIDLVKNSIENVLRITNHEMTEGELKLIELLLLRFL